MQHSVLFAKRKDAFTSHTTTCLRRLPSRTPRDLDEFTDLCSKHAVIDTYLWLSMRYVRVLLLIFCLHPGAILETHPGISQFAHQVPH
jgi:hypothetical protein